MVYKLTAKCAFDSGIWTEKDLPARQRFGPYEGLVTNDRREATNSGYSWEVRGRYGYLNIGIHTQEIVSKLHTLLLIVSFFSLYHPEETRGV